MSKVRVLAPEIERKAAPHRSVKTGQTQGSWIIETGGGGGGGGTVIVPAPPVTINPPAEIIPRDNGKVEIDVPWTKATAANAQNFVGVAVYVEDPDISSGTTAPLDGSTPLDGSAQVSGAWQPTFIDDSLKSPAVVLLDKQAADRKVRIYLAAFGPNTTPQPVRANLPNPTPNIVVDVPGQTAGESGQEFAFLVTNAAVTVTTDYNRPDPNYYLVFSYTPPDPTTPIPANLQPFAGCRIIYVPTDATDATPQFPGTDSGLDVPIQWDTGFKSPVYTPAPAGSYFRCYFCSEDVGGNINSLVEGTTPYALATVPPVPAAPDVTNFTISNQQTVWLIDQSYVDQATFAWSLPTSADGSIRYAGVFLYLVNVTGSVTPLTKFPQALTGAQSNVDAGFTLTIPNGLGAVIPTNTETWTVAAISVDPNGVIADDPTKFGQASFHSPKVTWDIGPPQPGSLGSGQEYAPFVTVDPSATVTATESTSSDGVRMVSFDVGTWTNPTDPKFAGLQVAMIVNHDPTKPTFWQVPLNVTSFQTPAIPAPGQFGQPVAVNFYLVSDDAQGRKNHLVQGTTPRIPPYGQPDYNYTPTEGSIIPARSGWFDPTQFAWDTSGQFQGQAFSASVIQVGKTLVVGGAPASFGGSANGQIAVENSSGTLVGWIGQQQPGQGNSSPLWGAWFGQLWVGGSSPLTAPLFIDNQGIIEVGGIAAQQGSRYPYISVRDQYGIERGRIGAALNQNSGSSGDNVGPSPPNITSGAWFTQLAAGGSSISNWCMQISPDSTNPLGSQFQLRNINLFTIDYAANSAPGGNSNNEYRIDMGNSVWMAGGLSGQYLFAGIHIYEVDGGGNNFGATFLNRGIVLRGHANQGYPVLVSLVTYNGNSSGSDSPPTFWGELLMTGCYSSGPQIDLNSGTPSNNGDPYFTMFDRNGNRQFWVDVVGNTFQVAGVLMGMGGAPVNATAYNVNGYGPVIDSAGNWKGRAIVTGNTQTPWTQTIDGAGNLLVNAGGISSANFQINNQTVIDGSRQVFAYQYFATGWSASQPVINNYGQFVGPGVNTGTQGIACGSLNAGGGPISGGSLNIGGTIGAYSVYSAGGYWVGYSGSGPQVITNSGQFVGSGGISTQGSIYTSSSVQGGDIYGNTLTIANVQCIANGIFGGHGVQTSSAVYGGSFGIYGVALGATLNGGSGITIQDAVTGIRYVLYVRSGLICQN